ncbi:MAG: antibiotic biosynthesis monooxygenase [Deltaproteobacteria bacterium]|nr:antibiotic biosynthesis monooxygenase [Deltaproteobacteria bacterium]
MVVVIAKIKAKAEHAQEVAGLFQEMVAWVCANEDGTATYSCNRSKSDPSEFVFFERYRDEAAFQAHSRTPRFGELIGKLAGKLDGGMELTLLDEVAAKI